MSTINGKLLRVADPVLGAASEVGTVSIALCGYGSYVPRTNAGTIANLEYDITPADPSDTTWTAVVAGNDAIRPAGTYYTLTFKNANGDIAQIMAFQFMDAVSYNIDDTPPFDPNQPPPPLPPLLSNNLSIIPSGSISPEFDGGTYSTWKLTLTLDTEGPFLTNILPGNLYTFIIVQDGAGGHDFQWPTGLPPATTHNAPYVNQDPDATTIQTFVADENSNLYPIGPATYFP